MKLRTIVTTLSNNYVMVDTCFLSETKDPKYETMVFSCTASGKITSYQELDQAGYETADEAEAGHKEMIKKWEKRL